ncbi:MAG: hypothetical protein AVDCRST_MAG61-1085, partial [uncultured Friedmanniella sp.]
GRAPVVRRRARRGARRLRSPGGAGRPPARGRPPGLHPGRGGVADGPVLQAGADLPAAAGRAGRLTHPAGAPRRGRAAGRRLRPPGADRRHLAGAGDAGLRPGLGLDADEPHPAGAGRPGLRPGQRGGLLLGRAAASAGPHAGAQPGPGARTHRRLPPLRDRARNGWRLPCGDAADQDHRAAAADSRPGGLAGQLRPLGAGGGPARPPGPRPPGLLGKL